MWYTKKRREKFALRFWSFIAWKNRHRSEQVIFRKHFRKQQKKELHHAKAVYKNTRRKRTQS